MLWAAFPLVAAFVVLTGFGLVIWILAASLHGQKVVNQAASIARGWETAGDNPLRPRGYVPILVSVPPQANALMATQQAVEAISVLPGLEGTCVLFAIDSESQRRDAEALRRLLPHGTRAAVLLRPSVLTLGAATAPQDVSAESARVFFLLQVAFEAIEAPSAILIAAKPEGWRAEAEQRAIDAAGSHTHAQARPVGLTDHHTPARRKAAQEQPPSDAGATQQPWPEVPQAVRARARAALPEDRGRLWVSPDALLLLRWASREVSRLPSADTYSVLAVDAGARARSVKMEDVLGNATAAVSTKLRMGVEAGGSGDGEGSGVLGGMDHAERLRAAFSLGPTVDGAALGWKHGLRPDVAHSEVLEQAGSVAVGVDGQLMLFAARQWARLAEEWRHTRDWRDEVAALALQQPLSILAPLVPRAGRGSVAERLAAAVAPRSWEAFAHQQLMLVRGEDAVAVVNVP